MVNEMSRGIQGILQFLYISALALCLASGGSGAGCSKRAAVKGPACGKTWTCDKQADEAMKRHDYEAAIVLHQRLVDTEPANGLALYHLGYAYGQTGDHEKEALYYEKAAALGFREAHIFFNLGMAYGELNRIEDSIRAFKEALDIDPDSADNHFGLALAYQRGLADKMAEREFLEAIKIDPAHVDARLYLSVLYADMGELQKAARQLRAILEIDPTNRRARQFLERIETE